MTCIVSVVDRGIVYMGGDSAGVANLHVTVRSDEKVFTNGPFIMGFTSSFRMGNLLRYKFDPPKQTVGQDDMKYMVSDFIDAVRKCFTENGFGTPCTGGDFLVGYNKKLYFVGSDFQVGLQTCDYYSVGCGRDIALGSLHTTANTKMKPEERIKKALEAAVEFSGGVRPPFTCVKL